MVLFCVLSGSEKVVFLPLDRIMKQRYRTPNSSQRPPPTFKELVNLIIDPRTKRPFNIHWRPYHENCLPCQVRYDFIGHYETLREDISYVLRRIGLNVTLLHLNRSNRRDPNSPTVRIVAKQMATLSQHEIDKLLDIYRLDFELFGYSTNWSSLK